MGNQHKANFEKIMCELYGSRPLKPKDLRGEDIAAIDLVRMLRKRGLLIMEFRDEAEVLRQLAAAGGVAMKQYECLAEDGHDTCTRLETVAKSTGITSAVIARHTDPHQDGYQFTSPYCGEEIAAGNNMPLAEILGYPRVVETRTLSFYDLREAALVLEGHDRAALELLTRPLFTIDNKYREADPMLEDPGSFPVLYLDPAAGARFRIGGSVITDHPDANTALALFRDEMLAAKCMTMRLHADLLFVTWQARVAHRGVRTVGRPGLTVLTRELWNFPEGLR